MTPQQLRKERGLPAIRLQHCHSAAGGAHCNEGTACASSERMVLSADDPSGDALLAVVHCNKVKQSEQW